MKALICSINTKYVHSSLAAWCLAAGIEKYASEVEYEVYETTINDSIENIKNEIEKRSFDIIGFCTYIWNLKYVNELCEYVKNRKIVKTVLGGPEVAHNIEENLQKEYVDYIISGEGELSFAKLCKGEPVESIEGLSYKVDKKIKTNPTCKNLSTPPYPYVKKYFDSQT